MLALIERPLSGRESAIAAVLLFAAGAAYCLAFTFSQGLSESPLVPLAWTAANLLPWLAAFELAKRSSPDGRLPRPGRLAAILIGAGLVSLALEIALGFIPVPGSARALLLEALRRVPGAALVLFLLLLARAVRGRQAAAVRTADAPLPLLPRQIDWIKAAGNYLEFHCTAGLVMRRMTIKQAESALAGEGFVRIHRSRLVNASRIVRLHQGKLADEVELADGTLLKVGGAFRSQLRRIAPRRAT